MAMAMLTMLSCGKDKKVQETHTTNDEIEKVAEYVDINVTASKSEVVFTDEVVNEIYHQYLKVKAGMVNTNNQVTRIEAKKLEALIPKGEKFKQLKAVSQLISLTKDITKQRDFMVTLTDETDKLISNSAITSGEVYRQFCPMAFDGTGGYWLSDSKEIRNPYYGDKMLKCGVVKETVK